MAKTILLESNYLPCTSYFTYLLWADEVIIESKEHYQKQSYRNRSVILGANNLEKLIIPMAHKGFRSLPLDQLKVEDGWQKLHKRAIQSAYGKAPFFEYYADSILDEYDNLTDRLVEINGVFLSRCLQLLGVSKTITYTSTYSKNAPEGVIDLRGSINPKKKAIISSFIPYYQCFGNKFDPNLSILDLLFCEGPQSVEILKRQAEQLEQ
jgi:hypothetical protein